MIVKVPLDGTIRVSARFGLSTCLVAALVLSACSGAPESEAGARAPENLEIMTPNGVYAIGGYDVVSYFLDAEPRMGGQEFSYDWRGATWLFTSAAHRELFRQDPSRYAPAYGGWCAYGVAAGYAAESDPVNAWTIHEDKLYLNWDAEIAEGWRRERSSLLPQSEENWPEVKRALRGGTADIYWHDDP
jgi:hypothetical protein